MTTESRAGNGAPETPTWTMFNILVMLSSIGIVCLAIGWAFGGLAAGGAAGFLATLVGVLVGLRLAKASHLSTSLLIMSVAVVICAVSYKVHEEYIAQSRQQAIASQTLDVSRSAHLQWSNTAQSGTFTVGGVSGFRLATVTFRVTDEYPGIGSCATATALAISTGSPADSQQTVRIGPFTRADQSTELPIPAGAAALGGTVDAQNAPSSGYAQNCPVVVGIQSVIIRH